jgi:hypothetical protein
MNPGKFNGSLSGREDIPHRLSGGKDGTSHQLDIYVMNQSFINRQLRGDLKIMA